MGNDAGLKVVWAVLAVCGGIGLVASLWGLLDSAIDLRCLRQAGTNGIKRTIVMMHLRNEGVRSLLQLAWVVIGIVNLGDNRVMVASPFKLFNTVVLAVGAMLLLALSVADRIDRTKLLRDAAGKWNGRERRR